MTKPLVIIIGMLTGMVSNSQAQIAPSASEVSPLLISETIPASMLQTLNGQPISTEAIFDKPTVLVVYRGGWCPYCNAHLAAIGDVIPQIDSLGYQLVAVSPDSPAMLQEAQSKNKLEYTLYSDSKGDLITALGIAFQAPERYDKMLDKASDSENALHIIPVPSLYIISAKGQIEIEYISPDYKQRISTDLLMSVLQAYATH
jgi:peroxiredoxin